MSLLNALFSNAEVDRTYRVETITNFGELVKEHNEAIDPQFTGYDEGKSVDMTL